MSALLVAKCFFYPLPFPFNTLISAFCHIDGTARIIHRDLLSKQKVDLYGFSMIPFFVPPFLTIIHAVAHDDRHCERVHMAGYLRGWEFLVLSGVPTPATCAAG